MNIKVFGDLNHHVYGNLRRKSEYAFEQLGHTIVENNPEITLTFGSTVHWDELKDLPGKKIFLCHGVDWWRGFESSGNVNIKSCWENCDGIAYSSKFAKHMAEKAFGKKDGPIVWNPSIPDFPDEFKTWEKGERIHIATCAVFRAWKRLHEMERLVKMMNDKGVKMFLHVIGKEGQPPENVKYYGNLGHDKMKEIYRKCHFYMHLAFNDYSPATVGEAMAWGLPVMITNSGGSEDMVQNAGVILENDPFVDYPFNIHREDVVPRIDDRIFEEGLWEMMNNLEYYQQKNKKWVLEEANIIKQAEKFINLAIKPEEYLEYQKTRGMTGCATSQELTPWIERFIKDYSEYIQTPLLDIGGGDGGFVNSIKGFAVGIDLSPMAVRKAIENGVNMVIVDVQKEIPFPDKTFKTVTLFHSLEHLLFPTKAIKEINRVVNGNICVIVPKQEGGDEAHGHYSYFPDLESLKKILPYKVLVEEDWGNMLLIIANNEDINNNLSS